jgi:hypothetical protein
MKKWKTRSDDEDAFFYPSGASSLAPTVFEISRPNPKFTGVLDSRGVPIFRVAPPKPPIGFSTDPHVNLLFEFNPETDFMYSSLAVDPEELWGTDDEDGEDYLDDDPEEG